MITLLRVALVVALTMAILAILSALILDTQMDDALPWSIQPIRNRLIQWGEGTTEQAKSLFQSSPLPTPSPDPAPMSEP
jgi:dsRNA-specific ribonuclease